MQVCAARCCCWGSLVWSEVTLGLRSANILGWSWRAGAARDSSRVCLCDHCDSSVITKQNPPFAPAKIYTSCPSLLLPGLYISVHARRIINTPPCFSPPSDCRTSPTTFPDSPKHGHKRSAAGLRACAGGAQHDAVVGEPGAERAGTSVPGAVPEVGMLAL